MSLFEVMLHTLSALDYCEECKRINATFTDDDGVTRCKCGSEKLVEVEEKE